MVKTNRETQQRIKGVSRSIVFSALKRLPKKSSWTTKAIVKFIKDEYHLKGRVEPKIIRALRHGVTLGLLVKEHGRYRLNKSYDSEGVSSDGERGRSPPPRSQPRARHRDTLRTQGFRRSSDSEQSSYSSDSS